MEKILAVTFDLADGRCKMYNALEWDKFIAHTRMRVPEYIDEGRIEWWLHELFHEVYGRRFWFKVAPEPFIVYDIAFDLRSKEFVLCHSDADCEAVMAMAADTGNEDGIFWAE